MVGLPKPGDTVKFRATEGHLVPVSGRPGVFYRTGEEMTETWTYEHHSRYLGGAFVLIEWPGKPAAPPPEKGE